ncbi:MAG TPA: hypothetical protein VLV78_11820 [Thermoanaerobaculia bacterium]|nr:hypothetical protein [Thermoanaerobaculia bacterium]
MAQDFEQFLREIFGEPLSRLTNFSSEQMQRLNSKLQELAREAVKDDFTHLHTEINELRNRVAVLEAERAEAAADKV